MGIIEAVKYVTREEGVEEGMEKGLKRGLEQKSVDFVNYLLQNTDFDAAKIASVVGVEETFVLKVKENLSKA